MQTASLVFYPGFVLVVHSQFTYLITFAAFYFMDKLGKLLLNKQAFFMFISAAV
jgi:hypothetical protein